MSLFRALRISLLAAALGFAAAAPAQDAMTWRQLDPELTVHMETTEGSVIFELNPLFAPQTVAQFRRLVREGFYHGLSFYRVIDGFVAQGGDESDINSPSSQPQLEAEFEIEWSDDLAWTSVQRNDLYAEETGFIDGFAAATDREHAWLTHCPGALAMARDNEPDTGSTDFYMVIGQAPRYLDRNLTVFGRVVHGMDAVQRIRRGAVENNGVIEDEAARSRIRRIRLGSDLADKDRVEVFVMDTSSAGFARYMEARRDRADEFFHRRPPQVLDVCQVPVGTRIEKPSNLLAAPGAATESG